MLLLGRRALIALILLLPLAATQNNDRTSSSAANSREKSSEMSTSVEKSTEDESQNKSRKTSKEESDATKAKERMSGEVGKRHEGSARSLKARRTSVSKSKSGSESAELSSADWSSSHETSSTMITPSHSTGSPANHVGKTSKPTPPTHVSDSIKGPQVSTTQTTTTKPVQEPNRPSSVSATILDSSKPALLKNTFKPKFQPTPSKSVGPPSRIVPAFVGKNKLTEQQNSQLPPTANQRSRSQPEGQQRRNISAGQHPQKFQQHKWRPTPKSFSTEKFIGHQQKRNPNRTFPFRGQPAHQTNRLPPDHTNLASSSHFQKQPVRQPSKFDNYQQQLPPHPQRYGRNRQFLRDPKNRQLIWNQQTSQVGHSHQPQQAANKRNYLWTLMTHSKPTKGYGWATVSQRRPPSDRQLKGHDQGETSEWQRFSRDGQPNHFRAKGGKPKHQFEPSIRFGNQQQQRIASQLKRPVNSQSQRRINNSSTLALPKDLPPNGHNRNFPLKASDSGGKTNSYGDEPVHQLLR